mmetsp:Transcript_59188/g.152272  ORF Transcript_59188/g.152272 Transcript_59188/m.152272 type:complete len:206 (+) Transcript_59188:2629-3246(+)
MRLGDAHQDGHQVGADVVLEEVDALRGRLQGLQHLVQVLRVAAGSQLGNHAANLGNEWTERLPVLPRLDLVDQVAQQGCCHGAHGFCWIGEASAQHLERLVAAGDQDLPHGASHLLHHEEAINAHAGVLAAVDNGAHECRHELWPLPGVLRALITQELDDLIGNVVDAVRDFPPNRRQRLSLQHLEQRGPELGLARLVQLGPDGV